MNLKYAKKELFVFLVLGGFVFWSIFQLWGMPSALAALSSTFFLHWPIINKRYWLFIALLLLFTGLFGTILLYSNVQFPVFRLLHNKQIDPEWLRTISSFVLVFFACIIGTAFRLVFYHFIRERENQKRESDRLIAELSFLKGQVNPHFLFNSLNSIYYQIDKNNETARDTLSKFSELLRYQLYHSERETIDISRETGFVKSYIELQKIRMNKNYTIIYEEKGIMTGFNIAPLLLIPLVENSFKYVSHFPEGENLVKFILEKRGETFIFKAYNSIETDKTGPAGAANGGIGLANVKRRLELIYPGRYQWRIDQQQNYFEIILTLDIHEN